MSALCQKRTLPVSFDRLMDPKSFRDMQVQRVPSRPARSPMCLPMSRTIKRSKWRWTCCVEQRATPPSLPIPRRRFITDEPTLSIQPGRVTRGHVRFVPKADIGLLTHLPTGECGLRKPPSITTPDPTGSPPRSHYLRLLPSKFRRDFVIHYAGPFGVIAESSAFRAGGMRKARAGFLLVALVAASTTPLCSGLAF